MQRIVIAGAGLAGLRAAQAVRGGGFAGQLTVVGDEPHPPYTRPPLSKELLAGTTDECVLPGIDAVQADWRLGAAIDGLDAAAHTVRIGAQELGYDRLILATGARARPWTGPGAELCQIRMLRGLDDARALREALERAGSVAILGAGFVGCEVAATARGRGLAVTLIDVAEQPMAPLGPTLGARAAQLHRDHGVQLRLGSTVTGLSGDGAGRVTAIVLADGTQIEADVVVVALGAIPNTEWLAGQLALAPDGGVICDATLTSSDPDVLAAGDIAAYAHPLRAGAELRVEHWTTAAEHGRVAGANALHEPAQRTAHVAAPYFWSDQYGVKIQSVGLPASASRQAHIRTRNTIGRPVGGGGNER